ncbi:tyrosine-protein phosphatase [Lysinibacillus cavernae]|uniref:tyrosine-protein phosphatase n=1 Tax=Lysinibacillus cavernae TaxID=2666135 RepID=UPI001E630B88|nr:CpsB/CapC family capsule biosynthesis tyrosine phosphatase [Lysinibacillus cavernae]
MKDVIIMIDLHAHVLYGVDDGPKNEMDSLYMLRQAAREGITDIICTSHAMHPQFHVPYSKVEDQVKDLQQLLQHHQIHITLHTGHEIRLHEELPTLLQQQQLHPLAQSKYILFELPSSTIPAYTIEMIRQLKSSGYRPILAHPERNFAIRENPKRLDALIQQGVFTQLTAGSLTGLYGKEVQRLSLALVRANYIHTIGSDAHNIRTRSFCYQAALHYLEKKKEVDTINHLLNNNASVLANKPIFPLELGDIAIKKRWPIF